MKKTSTLSRIVVALIGMVHLGFSYRAFPDSRLTILLFVLGLLLTYASISTAAAYVFRIPIVILLLIELVVVGPILLFGVLFAGAMSGDSGKAAPFVLIFILGIPLLFITAIVYTIRTVYYMGASQTASTIQN